MCCGNKFGNNILLVSQSLLLPLLTVARTSKKTRRSTKTPTQQNCYFHLVSKGFTFLAHTCTNNHAVKAKHTLTLTPTLQSRLTRVKTRTQSVRRARNLSVSCTSGESTCIQDASASIFGDPMLRRSSAALAMSKAGCQGRLKPRGQHLFRKLSSTFVANSPASLQSDEQHVEITQNCVAMVYKASSTSQFDYLT